MSFRRGIDSVPEQKRIHFDPSMVPPAMRKQLCLDVLAELGISDIKEYRDELTHGCRVSDYHTDQDTNPTASLNADNLMFHCFGCKSSGTILWLVATLKNCSDEEAFAFIEQIGGFREENPDAVLSLLHSLLNASKKGDVIPTLSTNMLDSWKGIHPYLTDPWGPYGRGIPEENCRKMKLGFAPKYKHGSSTSQRIIIPHFWKGDLVGWEGRRIADLEKTPKYLASPNFPKESTVYNYDPKARSVVVCESALSVVSKVHLEPHMEAMFTATFSSAQVAALSRHDEIILFLDNDKAGWESTQGRDQGRKHYPGLGELLSAHCMVKVVQNPWDADIDELTDDDYLSLVRSAVPYPIWRRPKELKKYSREV